jgi:hypothetical protein
MDAINLIHRYNEGRIDIDQTGIFTCIDMEDVNDPQKFADWMFGTDVVVKGGLKLGSTYIYAYTDGKETPDGFTADDNPAMVLLSPHGDSIFIYEIEDL